METFFMNVGFTDVRPIIADQHFVRVIIATDKGINDARTLAAQMVAPWAEMVTSVTVESVEI